MATRDQYRARRCWNYFIFITGALMISFGLMSIQVNERAAVYGIATGIIVLLLGLFSVGKGLREVQRSHPSEAINNTEDLPPSYRNTWRKSFLEECRLSYLAEVEPPPAYKDSWGRGVFIVQSADNTRDEQGDHILVLNPSTLARETARTAAPQHSEEQVISESSESGGHLNTIPQNEVTFPSQPSHIRITESQSPSADSNAPSLDRMRTILSTVTPFHLPGGGRNDTLPPSVTTSDFQASEPESSLAKREEDKDLTVVTPSQLHRIFEHRVT